MEEINIKVTDEILAKEFIESGTAIPDIDSELKQLLEPFDRNYKNFEEFKKICNSGNTVSFIGAGTSQPLGISGWPKLIEKLKDYVKSKYSFDTLNSKELPEIAEEIFNYLKAKGDDESYFNIISNNMKPQTYTTSLTLIKLILFINIHLTTNFDTSLENAYKFLGYLSKHFEDDRFKKKLTTYLIPNFGESISPNEDGFIYYLHGNAQNKIFILKKSDYDTYYPSISETKTGVFCIEDCLKRFFKEKNIMFIGFSFNDRYIKDFLFKLAKEIERENLINSQFYSQSNQPYSSRKISHFLIMDSGSTIWKDRGEELFSELQSFYISPIIYKASSHIFLEYLFESMSRRIA